MLSQEMQNPCSLIEKRRPNAHPIASPLQVAPTWVLPSILVIDSIQGP